MQIKYKAMYQQHIKQGEDNYGPIFARSVASLAEELERKIEKREPLTLKLVKDTFVMVKKDIIKVKMKDQFYQEVIMALIRSWEHGELIERWSKKILEN